MCVYTCICARVCLSIYMDVRRHIQVLVLFFYYLAETEIRSSSLVASALITELSGQLKVGIISRAAISNSSLQDMGSSAHSFSNYLCILIILFCNYRRKDLLWFTGWG